MVDMDASDSSTSCPLSEFSNLISKPGGDIEGLSSVRNSDVDGYDNFRLESDFSLFPKLVGNIGGFCSVRNSDVDGCDNFRLESDISLDVGPFRIFRVGNIHVLSELKTMTHHFVMK